MASPVVALTRAVLTDDQQEVDGGPLWVGAAAVATHLVPGAGPQPMSHLTARQGTQDALAQAVIPNAQLSRRVRRETEESRK